MEEAVDEDEAWHGSISSRAAVRLDQAQVYSRAARRGPRDDDRLSSLDAYRGLSAARLLTPDPLLASRGEGAGADARRGEWRYAEENYSRLVLAARYAELLAGSVSR